MPTPNNNQQSDLTALIRQELPKHYKILGARAFRNATIHPAKKSALYNPVKTDAAGNAVIKRSFTPTLLSLIYISFAASFMVPSGMLKHNWYLLLLPLAGYVIALGSFFYKRKKYIIVNREGIHLFSKMFLWADLQGVYLVVISSGNRVDIGLVLAHRKQGLIYSKIGNFGRTDQICTAVRDFQPKEWT